MNRCVHGRLRGKGFGCCGEWAELRKYIMQQLREEAIVN